MYRCYVFRGYISRMILENTYYIILITKKSLITMYFKFYQNLNTIAIVSVWCYYDFRIINKNLVNPILYE
jgi:hypothetical protein